MTAKYALTSHRYFRLIDKAAQGRERAKVNGLEEAMPRARAD